MAFWESTKKVVAGVASLSSVAGGIAIFCNFWGLANNSAEVVTHSIVGGLLLLFIFAFILREVMTARKEKYANISSLLHACVHKSRDLSTYLDHKMDDVQVGNELAYEDVVNQVNWTLRLIMDDFSMIFAMLTGTKCRTCIKSIYKKNGQLYVFVTARDTITAGRCKASDQEREKKDKDLLWGNIDFRYLYKNGANCRGYYLCNDLTLRLGYQSTSLQHGEIKETDVKWYSNFPFVGSKEGWPLPYRSTIVWPIQQRDSMHLPIKDEVCIGFLAVDSESRNVFRGRWDSEVGAAIADGLFHPLKKFDILTRELHKGD